MIKSSRERLNLLMDKESFKFFIIPDFDNNDHMKNKLDVLKNHIKPKTLDVILPQAKIKIKKIYKHKNKIKITSSERILLFFQNKVTKIMKEKEERERDKSKSSRSLSYLCKKGYRNIPSQVSTSVSSFSSNGVFLTERPFTSLQQNKLHTYANNLDTITERNEGSDFLLKKEKYKNLMKTRNLHTNENTSKKKFYSETAIFQLKSLNDYHDRKAKFDVLYNDFETITPFNATQSMSTTKFVREKKENANYSTFTSKYMGK